MAQQLWRALLTLAALFATGLALAQPLQPVPALQARVTDLTATLSAAQVRGMIALARRFGADLVLPAGATGPGQPVDLRLQGLGQQERLARPVDRERVVLERDELGHDRQPGGLGEGREHGGPAGDAGKARERRDADHRRDQDQPVGARQAVVLERFQGVVQGERAAIGEADQMQGLARRHAPPRLAHREPGGCRPVLPVDRGQRTRHGAVRGQARHQGHEAAVAVGLGDVALAEGCVGEAVQEDGDTLRLAVGQEEVRAVPVVGEVAGIDRAALEIAVDRAAVLFRQLVRDLGAHG